MNKEIKNAYIEEYSKVNVNIEYHISLQFERVAWYEEQLGKDVCNFTLEEILEYYTFLNTASLQYLIVINNRFSNYSQWCLGRGLIPTGMNHYQEATPEMLTNCINKTKINKGILTKEDIEGVLSTLTIPRDMFLVTALYEGVPLNDVYLLKMDDFIEPTKLHLPSGNIIDVNESLYQYAKKANNIYDFENSVGKVRNLYSDRIFKFTINTVYSLIDNLVYDSEECDDYIKIDLSDTDTKNKIINSQHVVGIRVDSKLSFLMNKHIVKLLIKIKHDNNYNLTFSSSSIKTSGQINYIKTFDDGSGDWYRIILDNKKQIFNKYGKIMSVKNFVMKYKNVLEE